METIFNNGDGKIICDEPKLSKEDPQETRHLKELLLLHLDWIQQQQETLLAKDRQIQRLRQEKESLRCRLERMDRRMALLKQKKESSIENYSPQRQTQDHRQSHDRICQEKAKTVPPQAAESTARGGKRKHSLEPKSLQKVFATETKELKIETANKSTSTEEIETATPKKSRSATSRGSKCSKWNSPIKQSHLYSQQPPRKCRSQTQSLCEESDARPLEDDPPDSDSDDEVQIMNHSCRSQQNETPSANSNDNAHCTNVLYYTPIEVHLSRSEISPVKEHEEDVKVPTFRIKHIPTGYQLEGTENLTDEAFLKRHQKPEADEKRRKRWDAQMLREQKMLERLQKRQAAAHTSTNKNGSTHEEDISSFLPQSDNIKYLEICDVIPVNAFGYTLPKLDSREFSLPWYDCEKHTKETKLNASGNRRK